jgi:hypothetical protein
LTVEEPLVRIYNSYGEKIAPPRRGAMACLGDRDDLGIHGEMCSDEILALIEGVRRQAA